MLPYRFQQTLEFLFPEDVSSHFFESVNDEYTSVTENYACL